MPFADRVEMYPKGWHYDGRKDSDSIFATFPAAHHDLAAIEVEILDAEPQTFHQAQASAIQKRADKPIDAR
jgi:hypothetical protein